MESQRGRADLWEAHSDERERIADERERVADERDALADERERLADRHDRTLDLRAADRRERAVAAGDLDEEIEERETLAALERAKAAVEMAEAQLVRAQLAADRLLARSDLRIAAAARSGAAEIAAEAVNADEQGWLAERRDFIAADRDRLASERDRLADERDETAAHRERLADRRDRDARKRERALDRAQPIGRLARGGGRPDAGQPGTSADFRARAGRKREEVAAERRVSAREHARAAGVWGPAAYGPKLIASFGELAQQLFVSEDLRDVLPRLLKFTDSVVAGCDWTSIRLLWPGGIAEATASGAIAAEMDDLQFGTGLGPALESLHEARPISVGRLAESTRWPVLASTAAQLGVSSVLCHGLFVHRGAQWSALGTMSLYSATPDAFGAEDQEFASVLAAYLSVATAMAQRQDEIERREAALHRALSTRDVIGQAKGILMERQRLSAGEAFDVLRRASQRLNRKVADLASHLAETGEIL